MTSSISSTSSSSVRYQRLVECIPIALSNVHSRLDVESAVRQFYGDGDNEVLQALLDGMLHKVQADVAADMMRFLQENNAEQKLTLLEAVIAKLERDAAAKRQAERADKESAELALQSSKLPPNVTAQDFVRYQTYRRVLEEKKALQEQVVALENEIATLEADKSRHAENVESGLSEMLVVKGELEKTADVCSSLS